MEVAMAMRRMVGIGLMIGMGVFGGASTGRAQEVGCCQAKCQQGDRVGVLVLNSITTEDCHARFAGCTVSWEAGSCPELHPGVPGGFGEGLGGGTPDQPRPEPR